MDISIIISMNRLLVYWRLLMTVAFLFIMFVTTCNVCQWIKPFKDVDKRSEGNLFWGHITWSHLSMFLLVWPQYVTLLMCSARSTSYILWPSCIAMILLVWPQYVTLLMCSARSTSYILWPSCIAMILLVWPQYVTLLMCSARSTSYILWPSCIAMI